MGTQCHEMVNLAVLDVYVKDRPIKCIIYPWVIDPYVIICLYKKCLTLHVRLISRRWTYSTVSKISKIHIFKQIQIIQ